jgi:hypothetical protein
LNIRRGGKTPTKQRALKMTFRQVEPAARAAVYSTRERDASQRFTMLLMALLPAVAIIAAAAAIVSMPLS